MFAFIPWLLAPLSCFVEHNEPVAHISRTLARLVERERLHVEPSFVAELDRVQQVLQVFTRHPTCTRAVIVFQDDQWLRAMIATDRQQAPIKDARTQLSEARVTDDRFDYVIIFGSALPGWYMTEVARRIKMFDERVTVDRHGCGYHPIRSDVLVERGGMCGKPAH